MTIDLDASDYEYRDCCGKKSICGKCIIIFAVAARIIEASLIEDFGAKNFYWGKQKLLERRSQLSSIQWKTGLPSLVDRRRYFRLTNGRKKSS